MSATMPTLRTSRNRRGRSALQRPPTGSNPERRARMSTGADQANLGPATREPGDPVRAEAIDLLACLASQPGVAWKLTVWSYPGGWGGRACVLARLTISDVDHTDLDWRERYAEAEARLRESVR